MCVELVEQLLIRLDIPIEIDDFSVVQFEHMGRPCVVESYDDDAIKVTIEDDSYIVDDINEAVVLFGVEEDKEAAILELEQELRQQFDR